MEPQDMWKRQEQKGYAAVSCGWNKAIHRWCRQLKNCVFFSCAIEKKATDSRKGEKMKGRKKENKLHEEIIFSHRVLFVSHVCAVQPLCDSFPKKNVLITKIVTDIRICRLNFWWMKQYPRINRNMLSNNHNNNNNNHTHPTKEWKSRTRWCIDARII